MKSPKMPKAIASEKPTAPLSSTSGLIEEQQRQRKKQGLFSTMLGQGNGVSNRLASYLGMSSSNSTANTSLPSNFTGRTKPGGVSVSD